MRRLVIAIDGPAGAGKSTVAREVAARLGIPHVDTGAVYRALALEGFRQGIEPSDGAGLVALAERTAIWLEDGRVLLNGKDVSKQIRGPEVTRSVSEVSSHKGVRERMVALQRKLVRAEGAVVEGRDIGTVVLPDADLKIFLTASERERARRRAQDLRRDGIEADPDMVRADIAARDISDSGRQFSPLKAAEDAVVIDSTGRSALQVVAEVTGMVESRLRRFRPTGADEP